MRNLVLITSNFPFGTGEPFIGTEIPFLHERFDRIVIVSQNSSSQLTRKLPADVKVYRYNTSTSFTGFILLPALIIRNLKLIISAYKEEKAFRKKIGFFLSTGNKFFLLKKIIKAIQLRDFVKSVLLSESLNDNIIFYSYWLNSGAHSISLLKTPSSIKISRAHASDLYEEKSETRFLPLFKFTADRLDALIFPSENGLEYFKAKTRSDFDHLRISRLGVSRPYPLNTLPYDLQAIFNIVSCSNLIPLKRVDLIIKSLEIVSPSRPVHWIHFGDGILRKDIEKLALVRLGNKGMVSYEFQGYIPNNEVLNYYSKNRTDLFINTSSTEGTPVSIMEAQSYGIPVIATDVGAVSEIVVEGTGSLLRPDFDPSDLANLIREYMDRSPEETARMRQLIIHNWETRYNAEVNYPDFISQVISIFDTSISRSAGTK